MVTPGVRTQQAINRNKCSSKTSSKYKGVNFNIDPGPKQWIASITVNKQRHSKRFKTEVDAANYYNILALAFFGENAITNNLPIDFVCSENYELPELGQL